MVLIWTEFEPPSFLARVCSIIMIMRCLVGFGCVGTPVLLALIVYIVLTKPFCVTLLLSRIITPSSVLPFMPQITRLTGECYGVICIGVRVLWVLTLGS